MDGRYGFCYGFAGFLLLCCFISDDDIAGINAAVGSTAGMTTVTTIANRSFDVTDTLACLAVYAGIIPASVIVTTGTYSNTAATVIAVIFDVTAGKTASNQAVFTCCFCGTGRSDDGSFQICIAFDFNLIAVISGMMPLCSVTPA